MQYKDLKRYTGPKTECDSCARPFGKGEVFTLSDEGKLAFCYSDGDGGCLQEYLFFKMETPRMLFGEPQVFQEYTAEAPLAHRPAVPTLGQRFMRLFGFGRSR